MKKIKCIKAVCFVTILLLSLAYAFHCFSFPKSYISRSYEAFYDEPENSVDGVVFGTSVVANGWAAPVAWQEYGMPVYQLGGTVQPFGPLPQLIDFVRSRQDIKYVVVDIHALRSKAVMKSVKPENVLRVSNSLHFGADRYRVLQATLDYTEKIYGFYGLPKKEELTVSRDDLSYYIPFLNLHNRWTDGLEQADYVSVPSEYKGAMDEKASFAVKDVTELADRPEKKPGEIDRFQKEMLDGFFSYLGGRGLDVLFTNLPSFNSPKEMRELKSISRYIQSRGYPMLDLCSREMLEEIGLDTSADFRDEGHLNSIGAYKVTRYICSYVKENYYYRDHRGEAGYESWDKAVEDYGRYLTEGWAEKGRDFHIF